MYGVTPGGLELAQEHGQAELGPQVGPARGAELRVEVVGSHGRPVFWNCVHFVKPLNAWQVEMPRVRTSRIPTQWPSEPSARVEASRPRNVSRRPPVRVDTDPVTVSEDAGP